MMMNKIFLILSFFVSISISSSAENQKEKPLLSYGPLPSQIMQKFNLILNEISPVLAEPNQVPDSLKTVEEQIEQVNLKELESLVSSAINGANKVKGKQVIILVAKTGAGKTTLIYPFVGKGLKTKSKFAKKKNSNDTGLFDEAQQWIKGFLDLDSNEPFVFVPEEQLQGFSIGHSQHSETKIINIIEKDGLVFVDTPGLKDTSGSLMDISNSIGIQFAIKQAKSIRFIFVLTENTIKQDRGRSIRELISDFIEMAPDLPIDKLLSATNVIISHIETKEEYLEDLLRNVVDGKANNGDPKVQKFITQIHKKISGQQSKLNFVGIGSKKNMINLQTVAKWRQQIRNGEKIQHPQNWFSLNLEANSIVYLQGKLKELKQVIIKEIKRNNFKQLDKYFSMTQYIRTFVHERKIQNSIRQCIQELQQSMERSQQDIQSKMAFSLSLSNCLSDQYIESIKKSLNFIKQAEILCNKYQYEKRASFESTSAIIEKNMRSINQYVQGSEENYKFIPSMSQKFHKIYLQFGKQVHSILSFYQQFTDQLLKKLNLKVKQAVRNIEIGDYLAISKFINFLEVEGEVYSSLFKIDIIKLQQNMTMQTLKSLKYRFQNSLQPLLQQATQLANKRHLLIDKVSLEYKKWMQVLENKPLNEHLGGNNILKLSKLVKQYINSTLAILSKQIQAKISRRQIQDISDSFNMYSQFRQIDEQFMKDTAEKYYQFIADIKEIIKSDFRKAMKVLSRSVTQDIVLEEVYQIRRILDIGEVTKNMKWIQGFLSKGTVMEIYNDTVAQLNKKCLVISNMLIEQLKFPNLNTENSKPLKNGLILIEVASQIDSSMAQSFKGLKNQIKQIVNTKQKEVQSFISSLTTINLSQFDKTVLNYKNLVNFLDKNSINQHILQQFGLNLTHIHEQAEQTMQNKFEQLLQQIQHNLEQKQFQKAKDRLQILKKYKRTNRLFGSKISQRIRDKLHKYWQIYMEQRRKVPSEIHSQYEKGNFKYVQNLLEKYKAVSGHNSFQEVVKDMEQMIGKQIEDVEDDLAVLYGNSDVQAKDLNKKLKRFFQFSNIGEFIENAVEQPKKLSIVQGLQKHYKHLLTKITDNLKDIKFGTIKQNIERFKKFNEIILMGVKKYLNVPTAPQFDKIIEQKLKVIKNMKIVKYEEKLNVYEQMKKLNEQYQGIYEEQLSNFMNNLKTAILGEIQQILNKAYDPNTQKLVIQQKFSNLQKNCSKIIKLTEFSDISQKLSKCEIGIEQIYKKLVYDPNYLLKLKKQDITKYNELIKQLKKYMYELYNTLERYLEAYNYKRLYKDLPELQKYVKINQFLKDQKNSPTKLEEGLKRKIGKHVQKLFQKAKQCVLGYSKQFTDFDRFLELQIISNGTAERTTFHKLVVVELRNRIPELSSKSSIDSQYSQFKILKQQQQLITKLKSYITQLNAKQKITDDSNIVSYINSIEIPTQNKNVVLEKVTEMKKQILTDFWKDKNDYNLISDNLTSIRRISISEKVVKDLYEQLIQDIKDLLKKKAEEVRGYIEKSQYKDAIGNLRKVRNAEQELKGNLGLVRDKMSFTTIVGEVLEQLEKKYFKNAKQAMRNEDIKDEEIKDIKQSLMQIFRFKDKLPFDELEKRINELIEKILEQGKRKKIINRIYISMLEQSSNNVNDNQIISVQMLIDYKKYFYYHSSHLNKMIRIQPLEAIKNFTLKGNSTTDDAELQKAYKKYEIQYIKQKEKHILLGNVNKTTNNLQKIKKRIFKLISDIKYSAGNQAKEQIPQVLANIFVYWSLLKSGQIYYRAQSQGYLQNNTYLLQPHAIQILSILRFLGSDTKQSLTSWIKGIFVNVDHIENQMMQIKTGEGKSLIMASMSILLALLGHKVDCVCYSKYLAQRDYDDFKQIFEGLEVINKISYGNFKNISQSVINQRVDIRNITRQLFTTNSTSQNKDQNNQQSESRILIVDQVDTFFSQNFYGATYNPATSISSKNIKQAINIIWKNRQNSFTYIKDQLKNSEVYKKIVEEYKDCIQKIDEQFQWMIIDVKEFSDPKYVVKNGKIGYKHLDEINFALTYGYRTMFAYIYESQPQRRNVNPSDAENRKAISITSGKYSYANIVDSYSKMFGVSGTLETLSPLQELILQRYKITKLSFAPSVYGQSRKKQKQIIIENNRNMHYLEIATKIKEGHQKGRPFLVFFKNQTQLKKFQASSYIDEFKDKIKKITQSSQPQERKQFIKSATITGSITLFTASFGRGTDFIVIDENVLKPEVGGVAVIQTFLSEQQSEQIQIKGRTARQGKEGTYQLILNRQQLLSQFGIDQKILPQHMQTDQTYIRKVIKQQREKLLIEKAQIRQTMVEESKKQHNYSMTMRQKFIKNGRINRNQRFFFMTKRKSMRCPTNYIFALDQSGSMSGDRWTQLKKSFSDILQSITQMNVLKDYFVSVIKFDDSASIVTEYIDPSTFNANSLTQRGGGTQFSPAFNLAYQIMQRHQNSHNNFIFISDGQAEYPSAEITRMQQFASTQQSKGFKFDYTSILIGVSSSSVMDNMKTSLKGTHNVVSSAQEVTTIVKDMLEANHMKE